MELIEQIKAAIDEDEHTALQCQEHDWRINGAKSCEVYVRRPDGSNRTIARCLNGYEDDFSNVIHIAHHDPARVLRQVKAHRKILEDYETSYRAHLDAIPADEEELWHRTGQGYAWFKVVNALATIYGIETGR